MLGLDLDLVCYTLAIRSFQIYLRSRDLESISRLDLDLNQSKKKKKKKKNHKQNKKQ